MSDKTCRICLKSDIDGCVALESISEILGQTYTEIYYYVCGLKPINDPQYLCPTCTRTLLTAYRFKNRLEENEKILNSTNVKPEDGEEKEVVINLDPKTEVIVIENEIWSDDLLKCEYNQVTENNETSASSFPCNDNVSDQDDADFQVSDTVRSQSKVNKQKKEIIQCPLCMYSGYEKSNYRKHVKRMHNNQRLKCDCKGCSASFHLIYILMEHRRSKHDFEHEYQVGVGGMTKKDQNLRIEEKMTKPDIDKSAGSLKSCPYCNRNFSSYKILREHCNGEHPEKKYGCPDCEERFPLAYHLKKHRRVVHNYQPENATTICGYCGKFVSQKSLDSHIKNIHFKPDTEYTCDQCHIKISTKPGLINHMRSKHMDVVYSCRHCPESFPNYSCRRTHEVRFHTFDYKYICNFCPKKFMERVQLRKHIATHTGERRYRCEICAMAFITLTNLKLHLASHSDARPHTCQICNAAFKTKMALRKHHRTHEERNYECPVCFLKYLVNQQLRVHIKRNHPEYDLPPPGTVMNKSALKRINAVTEKYKVQVSPSVGLSSRKSNF